MTAVTVSSRGAQLRKAMPVPGIVVVLVLAAVLPPVLGQIGVLSEGRSLQLCGGAAFAIAGLSLNLLLGYAGQISLGQYAFVGVGAFATGLITGVTQARLPWLAGLVVAAVAGGAFAFLVGLPALRLKGLLNLL